MEETYKEKDIQARLPHNADWFESHCEMNTSVLSLGFY